MKLIDIDTGLEYGYPYNEFPSEFQMRPTGKIYKKLVQYAATLKTGWSRLCEGRCDDDTHRAICFLEPLEKPNPMPKLTPGLLFQVRDVDGTFQIAEVDADNKVWFWEGVERQLCFWRTNDILKIYNGELTLIWSKP